jgi:cobalamin-dependent methionine synthase I
LAIQDLVAPATQTWGMTQMITGLAEVEVERLAQVQDHFQTERRYLSFLTIQALRQSVEEAVMENLHRGLHLLSQVI